MNYSTRDKYCLIILLFFLSIVFVFFITFPNTIYAQQPQQQNEPQSIAGINLLDSNLKLELVTSGLDFPTTMAFLAPDDFLILEKSGTVKRVTDGQIVDKPLLHVEVNEKDERGLLGIAVNDMKGVNGILQIQIQFVTYFCIILYVKEKILIVKIRSINIIWITKTMLLSIQSYC